ncbi:metal-sensing transcriptional repressor [Piscinibacter terrae]|uniref:metal-sensing transcriptional repressor n=1 Tax=Piscinibacter terrae TaxID=2496871 RepID=UPI0038B363FE
MANRLKRAHGHLGNVIAMLQEQRPCLDIVQQLQAVESAIHAAKKTLIHDHLDHCMDDAMKTRGAGKQASLEEFKTITKYL